MYMNYIIFNCTIKLLVNLDINKEPKPDIELTWFRYFALINIVEIKSYDVSQL